MDTLKLQVSKQHKSYVNLKYKNNSKLVFYKLVHVFRLIELCLISVFIWRNTTAFVPQLLPISEKFSTKYLHEFLMFLSSPTTVFLIGNAIVVILFVESKLKQKTQNNMLLDDVSKQKTEVYDDDGADQLVKSYKRSKSDAGRKKGEVKLRRSATVGSSESCKQQLTVVEEEVVFGKKMSDDEFRDMVEAFIARQQRNLRKAS